VFNSQKVSLLRVYAWEKGLLKVATFYELHKIELCAHNRLIHAQCHHFGHWQIGVGMQRVQHLKLSIYTMCCLRDKLSGRSLSKHILAVVCSNDTVRGIRMSEAELEQVRKEVLDWSGLYILD